MTDPNNFPHHIDYARSYATAAVDQINHAIKMPEFHKLTPKHQRLLISARNNLSRTGHVLNHLISLAHFTLANNPPLPGFLLSPHHTQEIPAKAPSPHNGQPDRSK